MKEKTIVGFLKFFRTHIIKINLLVILLLIPMLLGCNKFRYEPPLTYEKGSEICDFPSEEECNSISNCQWRYLGDIFYESGGGPYSCCPIEKPEEGPCSGKYG